MPLENNTYGAVETHNHITFTGFCKNSKTNAKKEIDVLINFKKVATIIANKSIATIENKYEIYEPEGFCFEYKVEDKYIGEKNLIEFKNKEGNLIKSSNFTLNKDHEDYAKKNFLNSLDKNYEKKEINYLNSSKNIGLLITKSTIEDKNYINFIKKVGETIENINIFYFEDEVQEILGEYLKKTLKKINITKVSKILSILSNIDFYIHHNGCAESILISQFINKYPNNIMQISFATYYFELTISQIDSNYKKNKHIFLENYEYFNLNKEIIKENNYLVHKILEAQICNTLKIPTLKDYNIKYQDFLIRKLNNAILHEDYKQFYMGIEKKYYDKFVK